ncbi:VOC family protein [Streptomyces flavidovirens]|uniref:VOC family protein n=1 Tax=Streptomyces flavidovirens TaxID=67298 RepID=UPI0036BFF130
MVLAEDTPGGPCWLSLMARDLKTAERFYGAVMGWTFRQGGFGRAFSVAEVDGVAVAGIGAMAGELGLPVAWTVYFSVADADVAVARVRERGGTVGVGPVAFPPRGRAALVADLEGASFGVWQGQVLSGWRVGEGMAPAWVELHTRNAFDAALFYGEVLDWVNAGAADREVWYEDDQVVLRQGGQPVARLNSAPVEEAARRPQLRPRWLVHFKVPDLEEAKARALEHGASIASGAEWGGHRQQITLCDPEGGLFTLDQAPDSA